LLALKTSTSMKQDGVAAVRVTLDLSALGYRGLHRNSEVLNKQAAST
jgi:hypothetical protein